MLWYNAVWTALIKFKTPTRTVRSGKYSTHNHTEKTHISWWDVGDLSGAMTKMKYEDSYLDIYFQFYNFKMKGSYLNSNFNFWE